MGSVLDINLYNLHVYDVAKINTVKRYELWINELKNSSVYWPELDVLLKGSNNEERRCDLFRIVYQNARYLICA